ncbi:HU family DNA-binding protein [Candidatus Odyssella thessalonicensis]|uniref:HU family DNA-binding protein n=1 Tax=Candidatus Odyssella thessalonicensis TaxID=84647 RepID=UPI000225AF37|nr:HU family DNA-binding protein [Candidatus Odyssella thessalonicensis]
MIINKADLIKAVADQRRASRALTSLIIEAFLARITARVEKKQEANILALASLI